ncbi:hypothetical protein F5H01DRAFT_373826 [Linnemannia elongata]|nr:hypothetical protein F5H01DRAFT_373826 [Linnemannia elongata]
MGIPIPVIEVDADRARSNICLAADCQCPECRHRHIIRLGSAIRQARHQELHNLSSALSTTTITGTSAATTHSGYIDTRLPDYRFRHSLFHDLTTLGDNHHNAHNFHSNNSNSSDRRGRNNHYSTSALLNRRRGALGYRGPPLPQILSSSSVSVSNFLSPSSMMDVGVGAGGGGSREPFTTSPTSIVDDGQDQDLHQEYEQEYEQEQWPGREEGTGQLEVAFEPATLEGRPHSQHQYQFQPQSHHQMHYMHQRPPPSSPLMRMRARAQEWASRMEGLDYYHDSDPEDFQMTGGGGRERQRQWRREGWMRRHAVGGGGGGEGHRGIMDRHERSSSDVGIEQNTIR